MPLHPDVLALIELMKRRFSTLDNSEKAAFLLTAAAHFATEPSLDPTYHSAYVTCVDCFASVAREQHDRVAKDKRN